MSFLSRHINSTRLIRTYNASTVLQTLYKHGTCSRSQLTKLTGMSPATITRIIADLMDQGVVLEGSIGKSTGGRRPIYIHIDHTKLFIASIKLQQNDFTVALLDLKGDILLREHLIPESVEPEPVLAGVVALLNGLLESRSINREHMLGVGVSVSGICQPEQGMIINSINLGWKNVPLTKILSDSLELPIFIENDANACALAELWFGTAKNTANSMYLKTESGAGAGIISNKTLLTGPRFMTGEIGHVPLIPNGEQCRCGQQGCLEPYVYFGDVQTRYERQSGVMVTQAEFVQLVEEKNADALQIVKNSAPVLALACAHWGVLLDLDVITIGGFWGLFKKDVIDFCQTYYNNILKRSGIPCNATITGSGFGDDADLLGAAGLVINHWLTPSSVPLDR